MLADHDCFILPPFAVLLGPLRAVSYLLIHGLLAASLGHMWVAQTNFWLSAAMGGLVRMAGQFAYLILSSLTMGENIFAIMMSNVYAMLVGCGWVALRFAVGRFLLGSSLQHGAGMLRHVCSL